MNVSHLCHSVAGQAPAAIDWKGGGRKGREEVGERGWEGASLSPDYVGSR